MNRKVLLFVFINLAVLMIGFVVFFAIQSDVTTTTTTGAEVTTTSSEGNFPFWIFIAILPAIFIPIMVASKQENADKAKNDDLFFDDKPKNDSAYTVGSDGELIELSDTETLFDQS